MAESIVSKPSRTSSHRSAASSARRTPATAASRRATSAAGSTVAAAARTACTSSSDIAWRGSALVERRRASDAALRRCPAPPHRLRQRGPERGVLVADGGVVDAGAAKACVPALDIAHRQAGERDPHDRVVLDGPHAALLVACRGRRPGRQVLRDPRVERVGDGPSGGRAAALPARSSSFGDPPRLALAAPHRPRRLGGPAVGPATGEDADLPDPRALLADRRHRGDPSRDGVGMTGSSRAAARPTAVSQNLLHAQAGDGPGDDQPLDLRGAFEDV